MHSCGRSILVPNFWILISSAASSVQANKRASIHKSSSRDHKIFNSRVLDLMKRKSSSRQNRYQCKGSAPQIRSCSRSATARSGLGFCGILRIERVDCCHGCCIYRGLAIRGLAVLGLSIRGILFLITIDIVRPRIAARPP